MRRLNFAICNLILRLSSAVIVLSTSQTLFGQSKPNIIVIYTDDLGFADIGSQGAVKDIKTPNIDMLAESGIRFSAGYVTSPQCSPSRAGLLTGRYPQRFGFEEIPDGPLPLPEITLANRLAQAGYITGQVGKWHLEPSPVTRNWIQLNIQNPKFVDGFYKQHIPDSLLNRYMPGSRGFQQFFTGYINDYRANFDLDGHLLKPEGENIHQPGYRLDLQTKAALEFIKRNQKKPFFLYLAYFGPHVPLSATKKYLDRFPGEMPERRRYALAMMSAIDDGVGKLMESLKQYGIDDNTVVIFASDNGAPLGIDKKDLPINDATGKWDGSLNEPMLGEKGMLSEGGIRVPFILNWPKLPKGKVYDKPVSTLDIAATALDLAGLPPDKKLDGINLLPYLSAKNKNAPHDYLFWRFWSQAAVRDNKWKLITAGNKLSYLFEIDKDPQEKTNLILKYPQIAKKLKAKLAAWTMELKPAGLPKTELRDQEVNWYDFYLKN